MNFVNFVNGNMVIKSGATAEDIEEAFELVLSINKLNEKIERRAEALAKVVFEQEGAISAIREVKKYIESSDYQTLGATFGIREAKEIVDRVCNRTQG